MHDATRLEEAGIPTAVIVTREFVHEAQVQRTALGMAQLEPVVIDHPLSTLSQEEIESRAAQAVPQILQTWTGRAVLTSAAGERTVAENGEEEES